MKTILCIFFAATAFLTAHEGLNYQVLENPIATGSDFSTSKSTIYVMEVDPNLYEIVPIKALDNGIGRESVDSIAKRTNAIAAVNGGFFSIGGTFDGRACGTLKINEWIALPFKPRGCIGWSKTNQRPVFDKIFSRVFCHYNNVSYPLDGLNKPRKDEQIILFTPLFHRTTLTIPDGQEIITVSGKIKEIVNGGSSIIPENGAVLSLAKDHPLTDQFSESEPISFTYEIESMTGDTKSEAWDNLDFIVGGTPLLIFDGKKIEDFSPELTIPTFLSKRHSRTAVGLKPSGNWVFVVMDKVDHHNGMTMKELTDFMYNLGCFYALNLDGGGSTTLFYEDKIVNDPHGDEDEGAGQKMVRRVSDAIVIKKNEEK